MFWTVLLVILGIIFVGVVYFFFNWLFLMPKRGSTREERNKAYKRTFVWMVIDFITDLLP